MEGGGGGDNVARTSALAARSVVGVASVASVDSVASVASLPANRAANILRHFFAALLHATANRQLLGHRLSDATNRQTAESACCSDEMFDAGVRSHEGKGETKDYGEALRLFHLAADQGHGVPEAQFGYAQCLTFGEGVPQDYNEAAQYCRLAADQGIAQAQCNLALFYLHVNGGLPKDHDVGVRYHRLAADQNFAPSLLALGSMLFDDEHILANEHALEPALANAREGARLLARAVQSTNPNHETYRLQALELLRSHANKREVVSVCCIGCGATKGLKQCTRCHVASFCGSACMRLSWRAAQAARWAEQGGEDESQE
ncbi:hypothetical protein T492DRAFT_900054 [Pavlovales sp. CCMP2436]|nr:hypothetical protein T492DRAFT_900054 [Pavlovales sp. CCMP2436]